MKTLKKTLVFIITMTLLVSMFVVPAAAVEDMTVDVTAANLNDGKARAGEYLGVLYADKLMDDGTVEFNDIELISYYLPQEVTNDKTYKVHVTGTCKGDFRVWFSQSADQGTASTPQYASAYGVTDGAFDVVFDLDVTKDSGVDQILFKGPAYGTNIISINVTSCTVTEAEATTTTVDDPILIAPAPDTTVAADGVLATANGTLDNAVLAAAAKGSKLVLEYTWPTGASADVGWGIGGLCFDGWSADSEFEVKIPEGATRDTTLTAEFDLDTVLAKGATAININLYNGISTYTLTLVQPDAVPTTGDTAPVAIIAVVAIAALCGMVVVNRKKAFR